MEIDSILDALARNFPSRVVGPGGDILVQRTSLEPLVRGYTNQVLILPMATGDAVVVRLHKLESSEQPWRSRAFMELEIVVLDHLSKTEDRYVRDRVPRFWRKDGAHGGTLDSYLFDVDEDVVGIAYTLLPGNALKALPTSMSTRHSVVAQVGGLLGRLHASLATLPDPPSLDSILEIKDAKEPVSASFAAKEARFRADRCRQAGRIEQAVALERCVAIIETRVTPISEELPAGVVHTDVSLSNVLWETTDLDDLLLTGLVDFDFVHLGPFLHDVGFAIPFWCISPTTHLVDDDLVATLLEVYCEHRPLSDLERKSVLPYAVCVWLRSLAWLNREAHWQNPDFCAFEEKQRRVLLDLTSRIRPK